MNIHPQFIATNKFSLFYNENPLITKKNVVTLESIEKRVFTDLNTNAKEFSPRNKN
jgi:hypothetical protein